jgi:hypothetical protein
MHTDTGVATLSTQDTKRHWPGNIGLLNVARPVSVWILCTQWCQVRVCLYLVYPMLPGQYLFVSCVLNVATPVSVCILRTKCYPLGTHVINKYGPRNIGYTSYRKTGMTSAPKPAQPIPRSFASASLLAYIIFFL